MNLSEAGSHCTTFMCDYVSTQFDPAHLLSELGFTIVFELLQLIIVVWLWNRVIKPRLTRQIHTEIDTDHNIQHHDDHIHWTEGKHDGFYTDANGPMRWHPYPPEMKR